MFLFYLPKQLLLKNILYNKNRRRHKWDKQTPTKSGSILWVNIELQEDLAAGDFVSMSIDNSFYGSVYLLG